MSPSVTTNIASHLPAMAKLDPDRPAIIAREGTLSFGELDAASDAYARGLAEIGIGRGVRTVMLVPPNLAFFPLVFAVFKVGAVLVMIDPGAGRKALLTCLEEVEPEAFIGVPKAHLARLLFPAPFRKVRSVVTVGRRLFWGGHTLAQVKELGGASDAPFAMVAPDPGEVAAILFTSGSTGIPKGAVYTHAMFDAQVRMIRETYGITPGEIDMPTFPLFALFDPALGMTSVLPEMDFRFPARADPAKLVAAVQKHACTMMFGSPALIDNVGRYGEANGITLPTLKRVLSSGAPMRTDVLARMSAMLTGDAELFTPFGATESLPVASIGSREVLAETSARTASGKGVCVGRPVAGVTVRIIRISDAPIASWSDDLLAAPGEIGEITVRGPVVSRAYHRRPEQTALAKIEDGDDVVHRMGDVGYFDPQGRLWMCGRKGHRVVTEAGTLFSVPVEEIFNQHAAVRRTALVGVGPEGKEDAGRPRRARGGDRPPGRHPPRRAREARSGQRGHRGHRGPPRVSADVPRRSSPQRQDRAREARGVGGGPGMKALVTGGGGFLGRALALALRARGDTVRVLARGHYPELTALGVETIRGDIRDRAEAQAACAGIDVVFHAAAKAGGWGDPREFEAINVDGTANVLAGALAERVPAFVHTSSPSVVHSGQAIEGGDESLPYGRRFTAHYPRTKAMAEQLVRKASSPSLATVSLRPHFIWGPGDRHLLPRLLLRARAGRLRQVGRGDPQTDTIYIDNCVDAHLAAADKLLAGAPLGGRVYFVSDGAPIGLWTMANRMLEAAGAPPAGRPVPAWLAYALGAVLEAGHHVLRLEREPLMTRFAASELSHAQWFDIARARTELGYVPRVGIDEGLGRLREWCRAEAL